MKTSYSSELIFRLLDHIGPYKPQTVFSMGDEDTLRLKEATKHPDNLDIVLIHTIYKYSANLLPYCDIRWRLQSGTPLYIIRAGRRGQWETVDDVLAWMDINTLVLKSGDSLALDEYGETWLAYSQKPD